MVSVVVGVALGAVGFASASSPVLEDLSPVESKVTICHATNSETNPYNKIEVGQSSIDGSGHGNHTGPLWYPGAKDADVRWGDIIPPIAGVTDGLNWSAGESTFDNDCTVVEPTVEITGEPKVTICHATNSENNPYNKITVAQSSVTDGGHRGHTGPVWYPGAKDAGVRWGDIIPPTGGVTGLNWPAGASTFNNDCELPGTSEVKGNDKTKTHGSNDD